MATLAASLLFLLPARSSFAATLLSTFTLNVEAWGVGPGAGFWVPITYPFPFSIGFPTGIGSNAPLVGSFVNNTEYFMTISGNSTPVDTSWSEVFGYWSWDAGPQGNGGDGYANAPFNLVPGSRTAYEAVADSYYNSNRTAGCWKTETCSDSWQSFWGINVELSSIDGKAAGSYTISIFSAGVPEPSTWISMVLGIALLGLMLRHRGRGYPLRLFNTNSAAAP